MSSVANGLSCFAEELAVVGVLERSCPPKLDDSGELKLWAGEPDSPTLLETSRVRSGNFALIFRAAEIMAGILKHLFHLEIFYSRTCI